MSVHLPNRREAEWIRQRAAQGAVLAKKDIDALRYYDAVRASGGDPGLRGRDTRPVVGAASGTVDGLVALRAGRAANEHYLPGERMRRGYDAWSRLTPLQRTARMLDGGIRGYLPLRAAEAARTPEEIDLFNWIQENKVRDDPFTPLRRARPGGAGNPVQALPNWGLPDTGLPGVGRKRRRSPRDTRLDALGGRTRDLFVDAVDPTAQGPDTDTVRGRIESLMGEGENAAYERIQKAFEAKNGRKMDVDTARLRALMETGLLKRKDVLSLGRELRAERDMSIARQLAAQATGGMPRDATGYIVSRELDPGRRLGRDDTFENAQRRVASVLNNGLRRDLSDAQRLFLAHRYSLAPEVRRVVSFLHDPGHGGEYGTVGRGASPLRTYMPGSYYQPGTQRVLRAGSAALARARAQAGTTRSGLERIVPLDEYNRDSPAAWWERTGSWAPVGSRGALLDPNWRRIRAAGTRQSAKGGSARK